MIVVGIDPGKKGALVRLCADSNDASLDSLEFSKDGVLNFKRFKSFITDNAPNRGLIVLEQLHGRGNSANAKWGANQVFSFGMVYGQILLSSRALGWAVKLVPPQTWQKMFHVGTKGTAKERTMIAYQSMFPGEPIPRSARGKLDDNAVDAWMIAVYGVLKFGGGRLQQWSVTNG
jgi:hypothetical protein